MNLSFFRRMATHLLMWSCLSLSVISLSSCGGSGGSDGEDSVIAPESLDQVELEFFGGFTMECFRLQGVAGNETGAATYNRKLDSFRYALTEGTNELGYTIFLPAILTNVQYTYVRTGKDTGQVTFTFFNNEAYPIAQATEDNPEVYNSSGDMFWGGRNGLATNLVVDILFTDQGGFIGNTTARIRSGYIYQSNWNGTAAVNFADSFDFDTVDVEFSLLAGVALPTGYNPYKTLKESDPNLVVWTTIQGKTIYFRGSDGIERIVAFQSVTGSGPAIAGVDKIEESGTILVDENVGDTSNASGAGGTYSYARTGGALAKMAIQYQSTSGGNSQAVNITYTMNFDSFDSGTFIDSRGVSGDFNWDQYAPN